MTIPVYQLHRDITGRKPGSNKQTASRSCALSIVRQLYHLGVIEAFSGTLKKEAPAKIKAYKVAISPESQSKIDQVLQKLQIIPAVIKNDSNPEEPVSLFSDPVLTDFVSRPPVSAGVVSWSPPRQNWNPWTGCNIHEFHLATASLDQLSDDLFKRSRHRLEVDTALQKMIVERVNLPVSSRKNEIMAAINKNSVIIIRGNTGCGKTTQVKAYCNIVVTQPRSISLESAVLRISQERAEKLGMSCGYCVLFKSCLPRPYGAIMFYTTGVLLQKLEAGLQGVSHVIVDEIHERDVNTDFLLVVLRDMVHTYPDLRVILLSATLHASLFSDYFNNCPVIDIQERIFPVKTYFLEDCVEMTNFVPPPDTCKNKNDKDKDDEAKLVAEDEENLNLKLSKKYSSATHQSIAKMNEKDVPFELIGALLLKCKRSKIQGAALVFLPGGNDIFALSKYLLTHPNFSGSGFLVFPLHPELHCLREVFDPVPRGVMKARYEKLEDHMTPEIFRFPLDQIALTIKLLRLGAIRHFLSKALQPPPINAVIEVEVHLREMKCLDKNDDLTPLGNILAKLPIEPRLGKMMILGCIFKVGDASANIAANISTFLEVFVTDGRLSGIQKEFAGTRCSDHLAKLQVFKMWMSVYNRSNTAGMAFCKSKQVSQDTLRFTLANKSKLKEVMRSCGFQEESMSPMSYYFTDENLDLITALLCMGLYPNVCYHKEKNKVMTMESKQVLIPKSSVNYTDFEAEFPSPFFVFGEKIRSRGLSAKQTTMVTPIHLLLFVSKKVDFVNKAVRIDNWLNIDMDPRSAKSILSLRPAIEELVVNATKHPRYLNHLSPLDEEIVSVVKELCGFQAGRYGLDQYPGSRKRTGLYKTEDGNAPPEPKYHRGLKMNLIELLNICNDEESAVTFLPERNLITKVKICDEGHKMDISKNIGI